MAGIVIESVTDKTYFKIVFDEHPEHYGDYMFIWPDEIKGLSKRAECIEVEINNEIFLLSFEDNSNKLIHKVAEVVGVTTITDNDHLATLIANLKG